jgi:hypothetical protein
MFLRKDFLIAILTIVGLVVSLNYLQADSAGSFYSYVRNSWTQSATKSIGTDKLKAGADSRGVSIANTAGTTQVYVESSSGNVGVGTSLPVYKLEIKGIGTTSASGSFNVRDSVNASLFFVRDDGNVGVGTSNPSQLFEVFKTQNASTFLQVRNPDDTNSTSRAILRAFSGTVDGRVECLSGDGVYIGASSNHQVTLITNGSSRMTITTGGNIGIGTTSAQSTLQVSGYVQLDTTTAAPPAGDCDNANERGRMKYDSTNNLLYLCDGSTWNSK